MILYDDSSSSSDEEEYFWEVFVESDSEESDKEQCEAFPGGAGTGRLNRKKPRKFNENGATPNEQRRRDHLASPWAQRFLHSRLTPGSLAWDSFRAKFRAPYPFFHWVLEEARKSRRFPDEMIVKAGQPPAPLGLQLAAVLRYLAVGCPVDVNEESAGLGRSTMQTFNPTFFEWFKTRFYYEWITAKQPFDEAGLQRLMKPFRLCGMPGAICSRDGVHIATDRARSQLRKLYTGKEGYPTWAFDCSFSHNRQFLEVHGAFYGATNDKTMVRTSDLVRRLSTDPLLRDHEYTLLNGVNPTDTFKMKGVHAINDGGYHQWTTTMAGPKPDNAPTMVLAQYGRVSESMRKDSECAYGIVKKRHRILRVPVQIMKQKRVENIFCTCAILHNMLMQYDGLDTIGELDSDYKEIDDVAGMDEVDINTGELPSDDLLQAEIMSADSRSRYSPEEQRLINPRAIPVSPNTDTMTLSIDFDDAGPSSEAPEQEYGYHEKLEALALNLDCMYKLRRVKWMKTALECRPLHLRPARGCPGPWHQMLEW